VRRKTRDQLTDRKEASFKPDWTQSLQAGGVFMTARFAIGDKVDQAFSNHARGTVVAVLTDRAGECRYAVEMFGHRTIQIANESSLIARVDGAV
jgi:hypothetical protein